MSMSERSTNSTSNALPTETFPPGTNRSSCTVRMRGMRIRLIVISLLFAAAARADFREFKQLPADPSFEASLRRTADATLKTYPKLTADNLAMTIIDVTKPEVMSRADYH